MTAVVVGGLIPCLLFLVGLPSPSWALRTAASMRQPRGASGAGGAVLLLVGGGDGAAHSRSAALALTLALAFALARALACAHAFRLGAVEIVQDALHFHFAGANRGPRFGGAAAVGTGSTATGTGTSTGTGLRSTPLGIAQLFQRLGYARERIRIRIHEIDLDGLDDVEESDALLLGDREDLDGIGRGDRDDLGGANREDRGDDAVGREVELEVIEIFEAVEELDDLGHGLGLGIVLDDLDLVTDLGGLRSLRGRRRLDDLNDLGRAVGENRLVFDLDRREGEEGSQRVHDVRGDGVDGFDGQRGDHGEGGEHGRGRGSSGGAVGWLAECAVRGEDCRLSTRLACGLFEGAVHVQ